MVMKLDPDLLASFWRLLVHFSHAVHRPFDGAATLASSYIAVWVLAMVLIWLVVWLSSLHLPALDCAASQPVNNEQ